MVKDDIVKRTPAQSNSWIDKHNKAFSANARGPETNDLYSSNQDITPIRGNCGSCTKAVRKFRIPWCIAVQREILYLKTISGCVVV